MKLLFLKLPGSILLLVCLLWGPTIFAEFTHDFKGEITGWGRLVGDDLNDQEFGVRYIPSIRMALPLTDSLKLDSELSGNFYGIKTSVEGEVPDISQDGKFYRSWIRVYTDYLEARLGLQEISFGPGKVLRSLQWFSQKDSRDPTGFTDGVKGGLFRYYFENDSNVWVWSLYGNSELMGISRFYSWPNEAEFGARYQISLESGEISISFHHRDVGAVEIPNFGSLDIARTSENRTGFDINWDFGVGVWLEATHFLYSRNQNLPESLFFATMGGDYTFDLGDGLYTLIEIMGIGLEDVDQVYENKTYWTVALSQQYSLNLIDDCRFFALHQVESEITSLQVDWKRTYDNLIINLVLFYAHYPEGNSVSSTSAFSPTESTTDKGLKLIVQYNH